MNDLLYHYTKGSTLEKIITGKQLWATDIGGMNDEQELVYASDEIVRPLLLLKYDLNEPNSAPKGAPDKRSLQHQLIDYLASMIRDKEYGEGRNHAYAFCMSEEKNLLSQWRGYAADNGYSIGFKKNELHSIELEDISPTIAKIMYGIESDEAQQTIRAMHDSLTISASPRTGLSAAYNYNDHILPTMVSIKHPGFAEEREQRLIVLLPPSDKRVSYDTINNRIVAHVNIPINAEMIGEVWIGPGPDVELKEHWLRNLFENNGFGYVQIHRSGIPLRV